MKQKVIGISRVTLRIYVLGVFLLGLISPFWLFQPVVHAAGCGPAQTFKTVWKTDNSGDGTTTITIPTSGGGYSYRVDINGDGDFADTVGTWDETALNTGNAVIDFGVVGTYEVAICGSFPRIFISNNGDYRQKIIDISQWGDNVWGSTQSGAFQGAANMVMTATDTPDLSNVTNMTSMFRGATSFNGDVTGWDTSNVTNMANMFRDASSFNQDISGWDVSNVTSMPTMLDNTGFNKDTYDAILTGWAGQALQSGVTLGAVGLEYCSAGAARQSIIDAGWTISGDSNGCYFITNITALTPVDAASSQPVVLNGTGTEPGSSRLIRLLEGGSPLAEANVLFTADQDWSGVSGEVDESAQKSVVAGLASAPGVTGSHTLYVPKAAEHDSVIICPNATILADVTAGCSGRQTLTSSSSNVTVVTILGEQYWKVDGLTGTGGMSLAQASSGSRHDGLSDTGTDSLVISIAGIVILVAALSIFRRTHRYSIR